MAGLPGLFDIDERLKRLSDLGDLLLAFAGAVDFEMFRADLCGGAGVWRRHAGRASAV